MTSSSVSVQGLTYQITCVSLENCLTSGVHLNARITQASIGERAFVCNKS
jgi:nitrous oxidase accessory protein NosD